MSCRASAIDLAVARDIMSKVGSVIRWMPHPLMPVDCLTKSDMAKSNAAQLQLLRSGVLRLSEEKSHLDCRKGGPRVKGRSRAESQRQLQAQEPSMTNMVCCSDGQQGLSGVDRYCSDTDPTKLPFCPGGGATGRGCIRACEKSTRS